MYAAGDRPDSLYFVRMGSVVVSQASPGSALSISQ